MAVKGLVVWQPWASLIALGWKRYEFRSWPGARSLAGRRIAIVPQLPPRRVEHAKREGGR